MSLKRLPYMRPRKQKVYPPGYWDDQTALIAAQGTVGPIHAENTRKCRSYLVGKWER